MEIKGVWLSQTLSDGIPYILRRVMAYINDLVKILGSREGLSFEFRNPKRASRRESNRPFRF